MFVDGEHIGGYEDLRMRLAGYSTQLVTAAATGSSSTMTSSTAFTIHRLTPSDLALMDGMLTMFGVAFEEEDTYGSARPGPTYMKRLLGSDHFIALAAVSDGDVVGGLAAYVLPKFEQERSEIHIYDLAVAEANRRQGIATALIGEVQRLASGYRAHVIFIQADLGDEPPIALYTKLGTREDIVHFDIAVT